MMVRQRLRRKVSTVHLDPSSQITRLMPFTHTCFRSILAEATVSAGIIDASTQVIIGSSVDRPQFGLGYDSVGGCGKAIKLMQELVELPLRFPELWTTAGVPTPKGVLLHGPPGCGELLIVAMVLFYCTSLNTGIDRCFYASVNLLMTTF